jgi:hypothetical protein
MVDPIHFLRIVCVVRGIFGPRQVDSFDVFHFLCIVCVVKGVFGPRQVDFFRPIFFSHFQTKCSMRKTNSNWKNGSKWKSGSKRKKNHFLRQKSLQSAALSLLEGTLHASTRTLPTKGKRSRVRHQELDPSSSRCRTMQCSARNVLSVQDAHLHLISTTHHSTTARQQLLIESWVKKRSSLADPRHAIAFQFELASSFRFQGWIAPNLCSILFGV